jgi:hypothetical protein
MEYPNTKYSYLYVDFISIVWECKFDVYLLLIYTISMVKIIIRICTAVSISYLFIIKIAKRIKNDSEIIIHLHPNNGLVAAATKAT